MINVISMWSAKVSSESQFNNKLWQTAEASVVHSLPIVRYLFGY